MEQTRSHGQAVLCDVCVGLGQQWGSPHTPPNPGSWGAQEELGREGGEGTRDTDGEQDPAERGLQGAPGGAVLMGVQTPTGSHCSWVCSHHGERSAHPSRPARRLCLACLPHARRDSVPGCGQTRSLFPCVPPQHPAPADADAAVVLVGS